MKTKAFSILSVLAISSAALAQVTPTGHTTYGGTKTISCIQGGQGALQFVGVWASAHTWALRQHMISYRMPDGAGKEFTYDGSNMTCLIEDFGQESVPVRSRK